MRIFITGGAGFIGSAVIRHLILNTSHSVLNVDKLTYAGNLQSVENESLSSRYNFVQADICDKALMKKHIGDFKPDIIMHLAAESHVDRSIDGPGEFIQTNIVGTYTLLDVSKDYWQGLSKDKKTNFRFHHISTDEVYGDLDKDDAPFEESTAYDPSSPYSASKASSDHLVRAWYKTFGLPIILTNCSNNYGPYQFPEKLIPHMILNALKGKPLPIYGDGLQIRDWLFVEDHVEALLKVAAEGVIGETYNIGGDTEMANLNVVHTICDILEELRPNKPKNVINYKDLISFVKDRPGHDVRYAVNTKKIKDKLGWTPQHSFEDGIRKTIKWYLDNQQWCQDILSGDYKLGRLG